MERAQGGFGSPFPFKISSKSSRFHPQNSRSREEKKGKNKGENRRGRGRGRVNSNGGEGTAGALLPSNQFFLCSTVGRRPCVLLSAANFLNAHNCS